MSGYTPCSSTIQYKVFDAFQREFESNMAGTSPTVESSYDQDSGCTVVETFPNDIWSAADWYCTDGRRVKTYTYRFSLNDNNYSVQAWQSSQKGTWFNLFKDGELATSITPADSGHCNRFMEYAEDRNLMTAIDQGIKWACGIDIKICMEENFVFYCGDEI